MKIDYLSEGSDDTPLIRLYDGSNRDYQILISVIDDLVTGKKTSVDISKLHGYKPLDNITLKFDIGKRNIGVTETNQQNFKVTQTKEGWEKIKNLVLPFLNETKNRYQWLDETSNISLLLSDTGKW